MDSAFWIQQPAVIVLYVHGNTLESRMKATGSDFRHNSSITSLSYGATFSFCERLTCHISRECFEEEEPSHVIQKRPGADQYLAAILVSNRVPVGQDLLF